MAAGDSCWLPRPRMNPWPPIGVTTRMAGRSATSRSRSAAPTSVATITAARGARSADGRAGATSTTSTPTSVVLTPRRSPTARTVEPGASTHRPPSARCRRTPSAAPATAACLRRRRGLLAGLEPPVAGRDDHLAEQPGRDLAAPVGVLVEIEDVGRGRASSGGRRQQERGRQVAGGTRAGGEGGGVDLHPGRDPDHRHRRSDRRADVAQRAVAAGDEEQVRGQGGQLGRDPAGVVGRRVRRRHAVTPRPPARHPRPARRPRPSAPGRPGSRAPRDRPASRRAAGGPPPPRAPPRAGRRPGRGPGARSPGRRCP